jgi:hypothetical protein
MKVGRAERSKIAVRRDERGKVGREAPEAGGSEARGVEGRATEQREVL